MKVPKAFGVIGVGSGRVAVTGHLRTGRLGLQRRVGRNHVADE
jgi:hypothetical protein